MRRKKMLTIIAQGIFLILFIGMAFYFTDLARGDENIRTLVSSYGYFGIFLLSIISGFNFIVPIPAASFLPLFLESGLNFWITILTISLGMTLADGVAYLLGHLGRQVIMKPTMQKIETKLETIYGRHKWAPLVLLFLFASIIPLPNELFLIPLAFLGYRFWVVLLISFGGSIIFNILYSQGIINLFNLF